MDVKLFFSTFAAVFLAELGDKTQLATLTLASGPGSKVTVFAGSALALVCTSALAVAGGAAITRYVPAEWLRRAAGTAFLVLGVLYLVRK